MLKSQKEFRDYLKEVNNRLDKLNLAKSTVKSLGIDLLIQSINETELLIPVVGAFSSGKSSLINSFLGKEYLPVGITPETALATEIRYAAPGNEKIEAVKKDLTYDLYKIEEIGKIGEIASRYKFIRLFISNNRVKKIEPLIIVDMPGFESPLDLHNQAIMEYLDKGVHYIVLVSVEDGTITRSMVRQLEAIQEYKRDFSFFLSKMDLRSPEDVENIKNLYQEQISNNLDLAKTVIPIDNTKGEPLNRVLTDINPEALFKSLFIDALKDNYYSISEIINTAISALTKSKEENEQEIITLEQGLQAIISQRDNMLAEAREEYSTTNVDRIISNTGKALSDSIDELVLVATTRGTDAFSGTVSEIVRNALIANINQSMADIGNKIVDRFSTSLSGLDKMSNIDISEDFISKISTGIRTKLGDVQSGLQRILETKTTNKSLYRTITTVLAVTTNIVAPIIEVIIIFLPDIMGYIMKRRQEKAIRNALLTQIIPSINRKLREELPKLFEQQVQSLIKSISEQFEEEITNKKKTIETAQNEIKNKISDIESMISLYRDTLTEIKALAKDTIF